ncbi:hypothetical protein T02_10017 [Trichinella nativa]|uniref:Uncharacterized protein n=1 Tax=Trichinella nativa TaxID=6335 RepID=A0A0V1LPP2_9BILA|nr:hypothetical protein T02_10017 [Trichinella nativa]
MGQPLWPCQQNFIVLKAHRIIRFVGKDFYIDRIPNRSLKQSDYLFCTGMVVFLMKEVNPLIYTGECPSSNLTVYCTLSTERRSISN